MATEADYWNPSICSVCGIELAPPVIPEGFTKLKGTFMEEGKRYNYKTVCFRNTKIEINEMASVVEYYSIPGAALSLEELDGYEWKIVTIKTVNKDPNVLNLGAGHWWRREDCYGAMDNMSDDSYAGTTNAGSAIWQFTAEWQGKILRSVPFHG